MNEEKTAAYKILHKYVAGMVVFKTDPLFIKEISKFRQKILKAMEEHATQAVNDYREELKEEIKEQREIRRKDLQQFFISANSSKETRGFNLDTFTDEYLERNNAPAPNSEERKWCIDETHTDTEYDPITCYTYCKQCDKIKPNNSEEG